MSKRPARDTFESFLDKVPEGVLFGMGGKGNLVGFAGLGVVKAVNTVSPIRLGYKIRSSSVDSSGDVEVYKTEVWAISRDVAKAASIAEATGPLANALTDRVDVVNISKKKERANHSLFNVRLEVERGGRMAGEGKEESSS